MPTSAKSHKSSIKESRHAPRRTTRAIGVQLLADLDDERFSVRQKAEAELEKMGPSIEPALRKALEGKPPLEARRRIEKVLETVAGWAGERLRALRALEAIEYMNAPKTRRLIEELAGGEAHAWLTREAKAVRARLPVRRANWPSNPRFGIVGCACPANRK
jgi:hypothetical protein